MLITSLFNNITNVLNQRVRKSLQFKGLMLTTRFTNIEAAAKQDWENFVTLKKKPDRKS